MPVAMKVSIKLLHLTK